MKQKTEKKVLVSLAETDITVSSTQSAHDLRISSRLQGGSPYKNKTDCEANGGDWHDPFIGENYCEDSGSGDWDGH